MGDNFVLLTYSATRDKLRDKNREAWPPEVTLNNGFSTEVSYPELYLNPQGTPESFPSHFRMIPELSPSTPEYSQVCPSFPS